MTSPLMAARRFEEGLQGVSAEMPEIGVRQQMLANLLNRRFCGRILKLGEVTEWFMVPLSKFAAKCPKQWFYVQDSVFALVVQNPF